MSDIEIIAEVGVNHNGDFDIAVELLKAAKNAGCDTVKFQYFTGDRYPHLQLSLDRLSDLKTFCASCGVRFLCTPDTAEEARQLVHIGVDRIKIGSSNVTNVKMLEGVRDLGLPVLLSTGACTFEECRRAVDVFKMRVPLTVMHCLSAYPPPYPYTQMNLGFIKKLVFWEDKVGFSDHTIGSSIAMLALAMGATVFEKHLTLEEFRTVEGHRTGPDHLMSCDPQQMEHYVHFLRETEQVIGDGNKRIMPCEEENRKEYEMFVEAQYAARDEA